MYKSDELHFTGGDAGPRRERARRSWFDGNSDDSELDGDLEGEEDMQLVLREKEDVLVGRALERIRRAQALGKTNVKLTPAESEALERKIAKDKTKGKKPIVATKRLSGSPRNNSRTNLVPANKRKTSRPSLNNALESDLASHPQGHFHPPSSSRPSSRSNSAQNLQNQPPAQSRSTKRFVSNPEPPYHHPPSRSPPNRRPLHDDQTWQSRSRSSSSAANPLYPVSPQDYAAYSTPSFLPQYAPTSRRNVSGPTQLEYGDPYGRQYPLHMPSVRGYASTSDPSLMRRRDVSGGYGVSRGDGGFESEEDDEEDDEDQGVQVEVQPSATGQGYEVNVAKGSGQRASATGSGRSRKGKR